jgi:uncharacterized protein YjbI with pentapeptide repeats
MANPKHLKVLRQGVAAWNKWRLRNPEIIPDLSGTDLRKANLFEAKLNGANLSEANLSRANLIRADLRGAKLKEACVCEANLSEAGLNDVDLWYAKLAGVNLSGANLSGADLSQADLSGAKLSKAFVYKAKLNGTDLSGANLRGANLNDVYIWGGKLTGADLREALFIAAKLERVNLSKANLSGADLSRASLFEADLSKANLSGADLSRASLNDVDLRGANLSEAAFHSTVLTATDLSEVKGLKSVIHKGPSSIGIDTFFLSKGKIPEAFLRGAGVPDTFIKYAASLAGKPVEFSHYFISHSSKDKALAERLYTDLQGKGVRCYYAPEDLKTGAKQRVELDEAIRVCKKLLLLLSKHSVKSDWVEKEVETAFEQERKRGHIVLLPIRLDEAVMEIQSGWPADIRRTRNIGDFTQWKKPGAYKKAFDRLLRDLKADEALPANSEKH